MRKAAIIALPFAVLLIGANHLVPLWLARSVPQDNPSSPGGQVIPLNEEDGPAGHVIVRIAEDRLDPEDKETLRFSMLGRWAYDPSGSVPYRRPSVSFHSPQFQAPG